MLFHLMFAIFLCIFRLIFDNAIASTIPSNASNNKNHCLGLFDCPTISHDVIFPPGNLTSGYNFTETYFEGVCQYIRELADCTIGVNHDFRECGYVESILIGYRQFYYTMCSNTSPFKGSVSFKKVIPCMNSHSLQLDMISLINKLIGKMDLLSTWPPTNNTSDTTLRDMSCRSVYEFTEESSHLANNVCGVEFGNIIYILSEGVASVTEKTISFGCDDIV